jgi:F-type H+-transporting ATPase subunit b
MNLVTPDFGLLFWMVVIFGLVFFLLAKFGFPMITDMVDKRNAKIAQSLKDADEIQARMEAWTQEQARMLEQTHKEQLSILREAREMKAKMVSDAQKQAREEAEKILAQARTEIAAEKESALRDIRKEIAVLSVGVAEKILRKDLAEPGNEQDYLTALVDEAARAAAQDKKMN